MHARPTLAILAAAVLVSAAAPAMARPYLMLYADENGFQALDMGDLVRTPQSPYPEDRILTAAPPAAAPKAPAPAPATVASAVRPANAVAASGARRTSPSDLAAFADTRAAFDPSLDLGLGIAPPPGLIPAARPAPAPARTPDGCPPADATKPAGPVQGAPDAVADASGARPGSAPTGIAPADNVPVVCVQRPGASAAQIAATGPYPETFPASGPRLQDPRTQGTLGPGEGSARIIRRPPPHPVFVPDRVQATLFWAPLAGAPYGDKVAPLVKERIEVDCHTPRWRILGSTYADAHETVLARAETTQEWQSFDDDPAAPLAQAALCRRQFRQAAVSRFLNVGEILANYQAAHGAGVPQPKTRKQLLAERFKNSH
jgi:hypothetical protein